VSRGLTPDPMPVTAVALPADLVAAEFLRRENRFRATVALEGREVAVHVPNPGRMHELFSPGRRVLLAPRSAAHRVTAYDLLVADLGDRLVSMDSRLPVRLFRAAVAAGALAAFPGVTKIRGEVSLGVSRIDFLLEDAAGEQFVEVKSCTLVENGVALFPDAPTTRGTRHMRELAGLAASGGRAAVVFVVQRDDPRAFTPFVESDPAFADALTQAAAAGVTVRAYRCRVTAAAVGIASELSVILPGHSPGQAGTAPSEGTVVPPGTTRA